MSTPGPWGYDANHAVVYKEPRYGDRARLAAFPGEAPNEVNEVCHMTQHFDYHTRTYRDRTADALLIASAPKMAAERAELAELFHELREYLDARADTVDDEAGEDGPSVSPNAAMILLGKVDKALESLEVK